MIRWLPKAQENLHEELTRIAGDDESTARRVAPVVKLHTEQLEQFPESGRPGRIHGTRELVISGFPYILPYRIRGNNVEILRFFHTSQNLPPRW